MLAFNGARAVPTPESKRKLNGGLTALDTAILSEADGKK
jgi:hypothetical protein